MKLNDAIEMVDRFKPNQYEYETKVKWLSKLDGMIFREVILTHAGCHERCFHGYDKDTNPETELIVPYPYDEDVYNYFLQSQIDKENGEIAKYNVSVALYNNAYQAYVNWINRTHRPLPARAHYRF